MKKWKIENYSITFCDESNDPRSGYHHFQFSTVNFTLLKAGVNIGGDVPDIVLHITVAVFQSDFDFSDGVQYRGMIPGKFLADVRQAQVGELADEVHGNLPGFGGAFVFLGASQNHLVHVVELADLADDEAGGGQGVAFALEHVIDGPGDVGQV